MRDRLEVSTIKELIAFALGSGQGTFHITRLAMYKALRARLSEHDLPGSRCLSVSHSNALGKILGLANCSFEEANFPEHSILALPHASNSYDFCVSDQVLEHVEGDPFTAFSESARVVKPGGFVCHTTCMINPIHGVPNDFWRFTPDALRLLATSSGCDVIEADGWGNREAWALIDLGFRFAPIPPDENNPIHRLAMRNEPNWPISTWVIARKR